MNNHHITLYKKHIILYAALVAALFFGCGMFIGEHIKQKQINAFVDSFQTLRRDGDRYGFINPLIGTNSNPATDVGIFTEIRDDVARYIASEKKKGEVKEVSMYFRDLGSPLWFGINEEVALSPASLFKLPIAITLYKQSESDPYLLDKSVLYTQAMHDYNKSIPENADSQLVVGKIYSVKDLIKIMIEQSDNGAKDLLFQVADKNYLVDLFKAIGAVDAISGDRYEISSRKYAHFLRVLYNASYLNATNSEYLLGLLAKSDFKKGLVAGVDAGISVAHKYGTYEIQEVIDGKNQYVAVDSDCGIIYHSDHPYVLCVMIKGNDAEKLFDVIAHISSLVYQEQIADEKK